MPNYDYYCHQCEQDFEEFQNIVDRNRTKCPQCGQLSEIQIGMKQKPVLFREGWYEHISKDPVYISSKRKLLDECKKHGMCSPFYG